jgi:hypothetical protein
VLSDVGRDIAVGVNDGWGVVSDSGSGSVVQLTEIIAKIIKPTK